jgi:membrane protein
MLPGAILFGIGVQMLHVVTVVWIARSLESKSETYGALGAALTILLWAYLLGRLITASASLNTVTWHDRAEPTATGAQPSPL